MKTVALIDFAWVGHHPGFFRFFCEALLSVPCKVVAYCPRPEEVRSWDATACAEARLEAHELTDEVQGHRWGRKVPQWANRFRLQQCAGRLAAWEASNGERIDLVCFACWYSGVAPYGDPDRIFPYLWTGLLLDSGCVRIRSLPDRWLRYRSLDPLGLFRARRCVSVATLDEFIQGDISRRLGGKRVHVIPEVMTPPRVRHDTPLVNSLRTQAAGRRIVGCFGQFARRKGALGFLRLAEACRGEPWFFVWAGSLEAGSFSAGEMGWINQFIAARPENCRVDFGRISDEAEFDALVALSDVLYLCYHQHYGSSNMISKAAAFRRPVIVSEGYCMADQTRRYRLGLCVPEGDTDAALLALRRLLADETAVGTDALWDEYNLRHSPAGFTAAAFAMAGGFLEDRESAL